MSNNSIQRLIFETSNLVFTRIQALIWVTNGLSILRVFEKNTGEMLSDIIANCPNEKSVLVNFKGVIRLDDHSFDDVYSVLDGNEKQLIIHNGEHLLEEFTKLKKDKNVNINHISDKKIIIIGNSRKIDFSELLEEKNDYVGNYIKGVLKNTFTKFSEYERLCSTPFLANGEFDAKKIIENPRDFMWFSFYMSDMLDDIIQNEKLTNIKLISASLRGSCFASILGIILDCDYITVDHIGPKHRVYDNPIINEEKNSYNYIYIGDFVLGGTEIKITRTYVSFFGSKLNHALVIGSLFEPEVFTDFKLYTLYTINNISDDADFKLFER